MMKKDEGRELRSTLPEHEQLAFQEKLLHLLACQTEWYTAGDSSSIRMETAQELLQSICYCLGISPEPAADRLEELLGSDLLEEYKAGQQEIEKKISWGQSVWREICAQPPRLGNDYLAFTLHSIPAFWKQYDARFFVHKISCDIDYPLAVPVPDALLGVDYMNCYLERLLIELRFLSAMPLHQAELVMDLYCPDHRKMFINLFEPVWTNALGCTLAGRNGKELLLCRGDLGQLYRVFENCPRERIEEKLIHASGILINTCGIQDRAAHSYAEEYCRQLAARIHGVIGCGGLKGIFLSQ